MTLHTLTALALLAGGPVDFDTDVVPVLTRAGCNGGACHGGASGRGGFKLSLLGGDPALDHAAIVREYEGRRVDLARPGDSLVLRKPTGRLEHGGDVRLRRGSPGAAIIERWIASGARRLQLRQLVDFEVTPGHHIASAPGERVRLRATARFDDGTRRDVTPWTVFTPADPSAVSVIDADAGEIAVTRRGQAVVVARYLSRVVPVRITVPIGVEDVVIAERRGDNPVDEDIDALLRTLRLAPVPPADDATFLRRARLALTGRLPSPEEVRELVTGSDPRRRMAVIDRLLGSEDFVDYWTYRLSLLLRIRSLPNDERVARVFRDWVRDRVRERTPWDAVARSLLTATGDSHEDGSAGFARMASNPRDHAELVSEVFLGAQLRCANCHDHPLDRWTQDDYHGLAAVFARLDRGRVVTVKRIGEVTHPRTGEPAMPRLPGERYVSADGPDPRRELADWLASPSNRPFARAIVNSVWSTLMGRGLVEPVDDLRETNPATHPRLLERLADDLIEHDFDLRRTIRLIATSAAFARGAGAPVDGFDDDRFYSRSLVRALDAEVLADAVADVTGVALRFGDEPAGTRAIELSHPGVPSVALDHLGRCSREASCTDAASERGLAAELHFLNGEFLNARVSAPEGRLARFIPAGKSNGEIVDELYLRALGRAPRPAESAFWRLRLDGASGDAQRRQLLEDFLWSLLSCEEFQTNH